jgi:hypothetical protein
VLASGAWYSGRMGQREEGILTASTRFANIDWMHRHGPTHSGSQPKASWMTRLDKPGFAGIAVSILVLGLGIGTLLQRQPQYSNYCGGTLFAPFAVLIGVLGILAGIVTWRKQRDRTLCCARAAGVRS